MKKHYNKTLPLVLLTALPVYATSPHIEHARVNAQQAAQHAAQA